MLNQNIARGLATEQVAQTRREAARRRLARLADSRRQRRAESGGRVSGLIAKAGRAPLVARAPSGPWTAILPSTRRGDAS